MYKPKLSSKSKCIHCMEEIKKADLSRKYAHELKNIFITISTVVNSEIENPHQNYNPVSNNTSLIYESGECSPYIMEKKKTKSNVNSTGINQNLNNNTHSTFYFLKTLCDYGKTLIKEINDMGKDLISNDKNKLEFFNVSKAINFCVDMFDTKKYYDQAKKNLEIYSDINFSYDKMVNSISETGFKMVLINLLTNSYKFTMKGHIIVRAVSMPKEKKIRIFVKDSGKGFNPKEFKKNGCFYVYEKNQDLNADGSGLGLSIVNEILTKFNIKLDCISDSEKGGSLFFFDIEDSFPYYDQIVPQNLMTDSLNQIINDINTGKQNKNIMVQNKTFNSKSKKKASRKSIPNYQFKIKLQKLDNSKRNSFMEDNVDIVNNHNNNNNNNNKNIHINNINSSNNITNSNTLFKNTNEKNNKINNNNNNNVKNIKRNHLFVVENIEKKKRKSFGDFPTNNLNNINNDHNLNIIINTTPNKNKIGRFFSLENPNFNNKMNMNSFKKNGPFNLLQQILEDSNIQRNGGFKEDKEEVKNNLMKKFNNKNDINYRKLLNKNFNKSKFYLFDIRNLFLKNEIYINIYQNSFKRSQTEIYSPKNNKKNINRKKTNLINNKNKIYIIICDDEEFVAMSAKQLLINYYLKIGKEPHVYFTLTGIECLYLMYKLYIIENKKIEYILLDMEMPYLNGIKTCNTIKSIKEANIPIYILSGDEPKDCTADGYCNKPLNEIDIIKLFCLFILLF